MSHGPLPRVARENLRRATLHIKAVRPGATDIAFVNAMATSPTRWHFVQFRQNDQLGLAIIDGRYPGEIEVEHPYTPVLWRCNAE